MTPPDPSILLVEDDADDVLLIRRALGKAGVTAPLHVASDGQQAVDYLAGHGAYADRDRHPLPALVLLDLKLPLRSGFEVLAWARASGGAARTIPVVVLTSSDQGVDVRRAYDLGANSYLVKPVSPDRTQAMVETLGLYWLTMNRRPQTH